MTDEEFMIEGEIAEGRLRGKRVRIDIGPFPGPFPDPGCNTVSGTEICDGAPIFFNRGNVDWKLVITLKKV